jgi:hypothetical protein
MVSSRANSQESSIPELLDAFAQRHRVDQKGFLCVGLVVTRAAACMTFPIAPQAFLAASDGQVHGLGKSSVQRILKSHGITRVLAEEGGRTSRGSIRNMKNYVDFLNRIAAHPDFDLSKIELWWINRVKRFFAGKPFRFRVDPATSLRSAIRDVLEQAERRQSEQGGTMFVGAVMQHLVGAKLELALQVALDHHGFSVADAPGVRQGDFLIGDAAIHVTRMPGEALIRKCAVNFDAGLRCLIVTSQRGVLTAEALADAQGLIDRIDIFEIEQFLTTNIYEMAKFSQKTQKVTVRNLVNRYNEIVTANETDPSMQIALA